MATEERIRHVVDDYVQRAERATTLVDAHMLAGELSQRILGQRAALSVPDQVTCTIALFHRSFTGEWHSVINRVVAENPDLIVILWARTDDWLNPERVGLREYLRVFLDARRRQPFVRG